MRGGHVLSGAVAAVVIGGVVLAGCTTGASNGAEAASVGVAHAPVNAAPDLQKAPAGTGAAGSASGSGGAADQAVNPLPPNGRQVIRSASIGLSVPDVTRSAAQVRQVADTVGGYTGTEDTQQNQADFTLQVPENMLDTVMDRLAALGHVTDRSEQSQDVTDQLVDVQSRIASQQASVDRVRALLAKATSISDIVSIEGELSTRESNLESLEQRQAELAGQVAMSSVTVHIVRTATVPPPAHTAATGGFVGGLAAGWHSFVAVVRGAGTVLGAVLPYVLGLGMPAGLVWWFVRRRRVGKVVPDPDAG